MKSKRILSALLLLCMLSSLFCATANASVSSSNYLDGYRAVLTPTSGGKIVITVDVDGLTSMTQIGASKIHLYESTDNINFTRIRTYNYTNYPSMMGSGKHFFEDVITYSGTAGRYYYAIVYCYAGNSTGYDQKAYTTSIVRAIS